MSDRIRLLASHVRAGSVLYDLCCDHGYIGWTAWDQKPLAGLYFVDASAHALQAVHASRRERQVEADARIQVITGAAESLQLDHRPADFVIAGVGIRTIVNIISHLFPGDLGPHRLILSPEKNSIDLRNFLQRRGFGLITQDVVMDAGRFREVLVIEATGGPVHPMGEGFEGRNEPLIKDFLAFHQAWLSQVGSQKEKRRVPGRSADTVFRPS